MNSKYYNLRLARAAVTLTLTVTRTAMTFILALLTTATAWADDGYNYIAADGTTRNTYTTTASRMPASPSSSAATSRPTSPLAGTS